MSNEL